MVASVSFDRVADRYDETRGGEKRGRELAAELGPRLVPGRVLEVGVGTGVVSAALMAGGTDAYGIDLSAEMLARARERLPGRVAQGDAIRLPIATATVANVLFVWSLHLVGDVSAALGEAARILRPGGRVIAVHGVPDPDRTDLDTALDGLSAVRAARRDTDDMLAAAAIPAGLRVLSHEWTAGHPISRSPAAIAQEIEDRVWSFLWRIDEASWAAVVVPVIAALRALPDPERPRRYTQRHRISVFAAHDRL
jgi:SAM-dependent methyltransferase